MSLRHVQLLPSWVPSVFPSVDINALLFNTFFFKLSDVVKWTTTKTTPSICHYKNNNWDLNAFWMPYFSISHLFLKKEIKLNNSSSHTRGRKLWKLYDPFADICPTDGQQLNRPKYRMTAWGKERTEIISTMTHTDFTTLEQLPPHKTQQVKPRLLQRLDSAPDRRRLSEYE